MSNRPTWDNLDPPPDTWPALERLGRWVAEQIALHRMQKSEQAQLAPEPAPTPAETTKVLLPL
jgi:hypothetical protein